MSIGSLVKAVVGRVTRFAVVMTSKVYWVILAYIVTRIIAMIIFPIIEDWRPIDAYWWGEVSSLTIGYGDLAPKTTLGRFLATPFHFFWVYYCGLALGGHIVTHLFRNIHVFAHQEQEWLFRVVTVIFDWTRWIVVAIQAIAKDRNIILEPLPHMAADGSPIECPPQAADTDFDNVYETEVV